jgi:hypothetical protein
MELARRRTTLLIHDPSKTQPWTCPALTGADDCEAWRAANDAITAVIPNMSVGVSDLGSGAVLPSWFVKLGGSIAIAPSTQRWLKGARNLFYAWHWYGNPKDPRDAVSTVQALQKDWNVAAMLTETQGTGAINVAETVNMPWAHWLYNHYCNTAPQFGGHRPPNSFGACILGW